MKHVGSEEAFKLALGDRLAEARRKAGRRFDPPRKFTQADVGNAVGVTDVAVGAWEAGRNEPSTFKLYQLAMFFRVSPGWLVFGEGHMYPVEPASLTDTDYPLDPGQPAYQALDEEERRQRRVAESSPDDPARIARVRGAPSGAAGSAPKKRGR